MDRLRTSWEFLRTSFWFVPALLGVAAAALAAYTVAIERSMGAVRPNAPWILYVGNSEDARSVLATLLSSMITMATPTQDPDFSIRHLDEIGVRALSPAVNDPYTAVAVIDRLSGSLSALMTRRLPSGVLTDRHGVTRVLCTAPTYGGLIGEGFNQIRQHGCHLPIVTLHLLEAIDRIAQHARLPDQHSALEQQAAAIMEASRRSIAAPLDRRSIEARFASTQRTLEDVARRWTRSA